LENVKQAAKGETTQGPPVLHDPAELGMCEWPSLPQQLHTSFQHGQQKLHLTFKAELGDMALDVPLEDQQNQQFRHLLQSLPFLST